MFQLDLATFKLLQRRQQAVVQRAKIDCNTHKVAENIPILSEDEHHIMRLPLTSFGRLKQIFSCLSIPRNLHKFAVGLVVVAPSSEFDCNTF